MKIELRKLNRDTKRKKVKVSFFNQRQFERFILTISHQIQEDWVLCKVFHKSRCNNETTMDITEINRVSKTVPLASASSSLCSPSSYIQFTPAVDTNKLPWKNNIISNNVEEVGGGFKLNGVDHREYSTIQQMKFEIEDSIQNDFIPFDYFTAWW